MQTIIDSCRFLLDNFPDAQDCRNYINSRLNLQSQELFKFGYFPSANNISALSSLIGEDLLKQNKLLYSKNIEDSLYPRSINFCYFENYPLILPFRDVYGNIVAIIGRTILSEIERKNKKLSKYKNSIFNKKDHLFGLFENKNYIIQQNSVYIVEGQFDVIKSIQSGLKNIIALGCSHMSTNQFTLLMRYTNNIFLLLDNDESGQKGRINIVNKFGKFANIRNLYLPYEYKDIDEFFSNNDLQCLSFLIED
jgi:DNA primase